MFDPTDRTYLLEDQYRDSSNLDARQQLHIRFGTAPGTLADWFFSLFDAPPDARILEAGCGNGSALWREGRGYIQPGWSITLSDLSPGMLEDARHNLEPIDHRFDFRVADIQDLPFADASFTTVIANHMLFHVPDRERALAEVRRVLEPAGRFYAVTIGHGHMRQLDEAIHRIDPNKVFPALSFTLESGAEELRRYFQHVEMYRRQNALEVTDPEAIVRYDRSGWRSLNDEGVQQLRAWAREEVAARGSVHIDTAIGMFVAWDWGDSTDKLTD